MRTRIYGHMRSERPSEAPAIELADAVMVGEGHAPVVAVLLTSAKKKADELLFAPKGARFPHPGCVYPVNQPIYGGRSRGRRGTILAPAAC